MYRLKIAGTDQVSFGPVPVLMVFKLYGALALNILFGQVFHVLKLSFCFLFWRHKLNLLSNVAF